MGYMEAVSVQDVCQSASWGSGNTFAHFYILDVTSTAAACSILSTATNSDLKLLGTHRSRGGYPLVSVTRYVPHTVCLMCYGWPSVSLALLLDVTHVPMARRVLT